MLLSVSLISLFSGLLAEHPVCNHGFELAHGKCLRLFNERLTRVNAQKRCAEYAALLASFKNNEDLNDLKQIASPTGADVWIGLTCTGMLKSSCVWDGGNQSSIGILATGRGSFNAKLGQCVFFSARSGLWFSGPCEGLTLPFVCEMPTTFPDTCANNYNGSCYLPSFEISSQIALPYAEAQDVCQQHCGNLASVHASEEVQFIRNIYRHKTNTFENVLLGARRSENSKFEWADYSTWNFWNTNFDSSENASCVSMIVDEVNKEQGAWVLENCEEPTQFLCKRPTGTECSATTPISVGSTCSTAVMMAPGVFTSPNHPNDYSENTTCTYSLATTKPYRIQLTFVDFQTEYNYDEVKVYDGSSADSRLIRTMSGGNKSFSDLHVVSSSNTMFVTFESDGSFNHRGFSAKFSTLFYSKTK